MRIAAVHELDVEADISVQRERFEHVAGHRSCEVSTDQVVLLTLRFAAVHHIRAARNVYHRTRKRLVERDERVAMCGEDAMEKYLATGPLGEADIAELTGRRALFPCFFGSGLRLDGVDALLDALDRYTRQPPDSGQFAAKVYKIARDAQGNRMSFMKLTGGALAVRTALKYKNEDGLEREEKLSQLRLYSGLRYEAAET